MLIVAGEAVFVLPFVLARVFRPTVLEVYSLDNVDLGICFSIYGIVALFCYLFGGPVADKYEPRKLMAISLWLTALGGIVYASIPSQLVLRILYAYWGFTTIFLFWSPMIKATRIWGGRSRQGLAFGFLDGGRGLVGALFASLTLAVFSFYHSKDQDSSSIVNHQAFQNVIWVCVVFLFIIGILVWKFLQAESEEKENQTESIDFLAIGRVSKIPNVRLLMLIVLCAYFGYKVTDIFSLYASDVMLFDQVYSAGVGTVLLYLRPVVGITIGLIADRHRLSLLLLISFIISILGALILTFGLVSSGEVFLFFISIMLTACGIYGARCLYFAVMEEGKIPIHLTGTAIGLVSIIGLTPDIFAGPMMGYYLDLYPGILGHQIVFGMLVAFSILGACASFIFYVRNK